MELERKSGLMVSITRDSLRVERLKAMGHFNKIILLKVYHMACSRMVKFMVTEFKYSLMEVFIEESS